jgi:hypothetical protein
MLVKGHLSPQFLVILGAFSLGKYDKNISSNLLTLNRLSVIIDTSFNTKEQK